MKKTMLPLLAAAVSMLLGGMARSAEIPENWSKNCASCHGPDGAGHTKAGRMAQVKDMTSADYQKTFTDEQAIKQIKEGYKDSSGKERMKAFADKLSDDEVKALVAYVRSLSK